MACVLWRPRLFPLSIGWYKFTISSPFRPSEVRRSVFQFKQMKWNFRGNISTSCGFAEERSDDAAEKNVCLDSGLYLVATPIGNLEDITLRALRVLKAADIILSEDTRHSRKLLQHYGLNTPLMSYHKFNESHRQATILQRLQQGQIIALISDAGTPAISDPGAEIVKVCIEKNFRVFPIPGPCSIIAALTASGLPTSEFSFFGFLPSHNTTRKTKLISAAKESATQVFYVPPHKLQSLLEESISFFGEARQCVIAREMTKVYEEFWRGTLAEAKRKFSQSTPKGEITLLIQGAEDQSIESPKEAELENQLQSLFSNGYCLSEAVKLVSERMSIKKKLVYAIALRMHKSGDKSETIQSNTEDDAHLRE